MKSLSPAQHNHVLSLLDAGQSACQISSKTGLHNSTISQLHSKHHPHLQKSSGGCPSKLSSADVHFAQCLITTRKAENAVQIAGALVDAGGQVELHRGCTVLRRELEVQDLVTGQVSSLDSSASS